MQPPNSGTGPRLGVAGAVNDVPPSRPIPRPTSPSRAQLWRCAYTAVGLGLALALILFISHIVAYPVLHLNDVAATSIVAPHDFTVQDQGATDVRRQMAARAVPPRYRVDPRPQQQAQAQAAALLRLARRLRARPVTSPERQSAALVQASGGTISQALATQLLGLSAGDLAQVDDLLGHALKVAAGQPVAPNQLMVLQPALPAGVPAGPVRTITDELFGAFLQPNRFPDATLTSQAQQQAMAQVPPVLVTYRQGQVIVRAGDVVDAQAMLALRAAGLDVAPITWQIFFADVLICLVAAGLVHGYLISIRSPLLVRPRQIALLDALFVSALVSVAFVFQSHSLLPYVFPAATLSMLITVLLNGELSLLVAAVWAVLAGWYLNASFEMTTYYLVTGTVGALLVRDVRRSGQFFAAGLAVSATGLATILAFRLLNQGYDWLGLGTYAVGALVSGGLAAALALGSLSLLGRLFGVTTALHLLELSHPNHPLLRRLMVEAPGTFHHSMMIGTLAERAAEQIGADPLLVRVIASFHDIGKLVEPTYFAENQAGIRNVHEGLEPQESVRLIQQHVYEGVRLARQHHLPEVLEDGIWQHHGTNLVSFFYQQAVALHGEENVKVEDYRYPGPRPQSREMAILMLADAVEAAVRASPGLDGDQIRALIHRLVQDRLRDGQLDECNLTLRDMALIEESFATVLQGISHPRLQYPAPLPVAAGNG